MHRLIQSLMTLLLAFAATVALAETGRDPLSQVEVGPVQFSYQGNRECCGQVTALAELTNKATTRVSDLVVEVRYLDAQGRMVDATTQSLYGVRIAPGATAAVQVESAAAQPRTSYATAQLRIVDLVFPQSQSDSKRSFWIEMLFSWGPMLLLIGVWVFLMRRYSVDYQKRYAELMAEQNQWMARQVAALEALATRRQSLD